MSERIPALNNDGGSDLTNEYEAQIRAYCKGEERAREIEQSLTKSRRFKENIFHRFTKAIVEFDMIQPGDKIAVCISGGKDSMLMAKLFQELKRHDKFPFELIFLVMDPGYNELNRLMIESNARMMGIPITVFDISIFDAVYKIEKSPCYLCARMRRGWLYKKAQELGCNKIALGHHFSDVIETTLIGMFYSSQMSAMLPKLHSKNYEGMELIRPLYCVHEDDILSWVRYNGLSFLQCACRLTENTESGVSDSKRKEIKELIRSLRKDNPDIEISIFNSLHSVEINTFPGYKLEGKEHSFLEHYTDTD